MESTVTPMAMATTMLGVHHLSSSCWDANPTFRDLGENATSQIIGVTHKRKTRSRKMKHDASKTLGEWTKKQHDTIEFCKLAIRSRSNNP
jgi:hypothetical protein